MASIKDVAQHAGVSTTTVSRVLSDPEAVRPALREQVRCAIAALGYRPNLAARRLRQQRASLIGLIVSDIRNPFFTDIGRAVEDMAYRHGLRLILCNTDEDPAKEQSYLELMADEQASGVIISPTPERLDRMRPRARGARPPDAAAAGEWPFPWVLVDRAPAPPATAPCDMVLLDNAGAAEQLTAHLAARGYRRIALLAGSRSSTGRERHDGYAQALRAHGLAPQARWLPPTVEAGVAAAAELLRGPDRPDALVATNGLLLMGALQAIQAAGLAVPGDIALAGFDNNDWTALPSLDVTVIAQPTYDIGRSATEMLLQRIADPDRPARRMVLDGRLVVRGSTAARPPAG